MLVFDQDVAVYDHAALTNIHVKVFVGVAVDAGVAVLVTACKGGAVNDDAAASVCIQNGVEAVASGVFVGVVACTPQQEVIAQAALEGVGSGIAHQQVGSAAAREGVLIRIHRGNQ